MSSTATAWVWANSPYKGTKRLIHLAVAEVVNHQYDHRFWMSNKNLAKECNCERTTVNAALKEFVADGYLEVVKEATGRSKTVEYRFLRPGSVGSADESVGSTQITDSESVGSTDENRLKCPESRHELKKEEPKTDTTTKKEPNGTSDRSLVWQAYLDGIREFNPRARGATLDSNRKALIDNALKNYSVEDLILAVTGWLKSPWHTGENPTGTIHNKLGLLLKNSDKIEQFIGYHDAKKPISKGNVNDAHGRERVRSSDIIDLDDDDEDFIDD